MQNRVLYTLGMALPLAVAVITGFTDHNPVFAQLTPDNTLGAENSIVTPQQLRDLIQGGAIRDNPGDIAVNQGNLTVSQGQGLSLLGGNVSVAGSGDINNLQGSLTATGGRIELGGLTAAGTVNINPDLSLGFPDGVARGDVFLTDGAFINASTVGVNDAGGVTIQASSVNLENSSVFAQVSAGTQGDGGSINITTDFLSLTNGAQISTATLGEGDAGTITISATDAISIDGVNGTGTNFPSAILATVQAEAVGNGGNIEIIVNGSLDLSNGGFIGSSTFGQGNAGDISINSNNMTLAGVDDTGFSSGIQSAVANTGFGDGGNININTEFFSLTNGARISTGNFGFSIGNAGNISINATDTIFINGIGTNNFSSGILASVQGIGDAGDVNISTSLLSLTDGGNIQATVRTGAQGFGGRINIATESLNLTNGAQINASTLGEGNTGNINISATDAISIDGVGSTGFSSRITANVLRQAEGNSADVNIVTDSLSLANGGFIGISTFAQGDGGSIVIDADTITADGVGTNGVISGIQASVGVGAEGDVGDILIFTDSLELTNGAAISVSNSGVGNAGQVLITSDNLTLQNNGLISAQDNSGAGGFIGLQIEDLILLDNSTISAVGTLAGSLDLQSTALIMTNGSLITVDSDDSVSFSFGVGAIFISQDSVISIGETNFDDRFNTQVSIITPTVEVEPIEPDQQISQSVCSDFGGDSQLSNTGRGGIPQIPGLVVRNSVVNVDLVDEVLLPPPPPEAIKPHHRTDVTYLNSEGEETKPAMGAVLLPNGMVEFVDYSPAEVYRDMYAAAGCNRLSNE